MAGPPHLRRSPLSEKVRGVDPQAHASAVVGSVRRRPRDACHQVPPDLHPPEPAVEQVRPITPADERVMLNVLPLTDLTDTQ